ncbi:MAG: GNAT family N-acetyltransferase [Bacteriovoracia bacterium]
MSAKPIQELRTHNPSFNPAFKRLNLAWIEQYFRVEKKDLEQVNNPEECLRGGGEIFFVVVEGEAVGTCAMYKTGPRQFELAKMAVDPNYRGLGYGDLLMEKAEAWAKEKGANEILILSNTVLEPAISLYRKHGYTVTHLGPHPDYERCNIEMRKTL